MRTLFIPCRHPYSAWLFDALHESGHSLQRAEDVPDSILLAAQEVFDAVVATALDSRTQGTLVAQSPLSSMKTVSIVVPSALSGPVATNRMFEATCRMPG